MSNLSRDESKMVDHHLQMAEKIHNGLSPHHHDLVNKHQDHFSTYINKTVQTGEKPSTKGLRSHIEKRMGAEVDKVKTEKAKNRKRENVKNTLMHHDTHEHEFHKALQIHHHIQSAKNILTHGLHKAQEKHNPMQQSIDGKKTSPEGYVVQHKGQIVKMVDRGEFSRANFAAKTAFKG
jgi:hypothetical protein